jgi:threonine dehydratase
VTTVTTASAGNHGLALAKAGSEMGIAVRVHLPATAPRAKKDALERYGAKTIEAPTYDEAERRAREEVARGGVTFISAYSHSDVIAGAGTVVLEMLAARPDLDMFVVPLGGGGLLSGTAIWVRNHAAGATIVGAEADASPVFTAAMRAGRPVTVDVHKTVADGLAGNMEPDSQTFPIVRDLVDRVIRVPEPAIVSAMTDLAALDGIVAEGASATAVGALLQSGNRSGGPARRRHPVRLECRRALQLAMPRVAILGAGPIGASIAQRLAERSRVADVLLIDDNGSLAQGKALDLMQSGPIDGSSTRLAGGADSLAAAGADVIVLADDSRAGRGMVTGASN